MALSFKIVKDDSIKCIKLKDKAVLLALTEMGLEMERSAKQHETRVDTGLLRNSITYALDGSGAAIGEYHADKGGGSGSYSGTTPAEGGGKRAVYVGTNVEYAGFVENGTSKMTATPFIGPAVNGQNGKFAAILEKHMRDA